jgi:hypothetical protein
MHRDDDHGVAVEGQSPEDQQIQQSEHEADDAEDGASDNVRKFDASVIDISCLAMHTAMIPKKLG